MPAYRVEVHALKPCDHVTAVRCFKAGTGLDAQHVAARIVAGPLMARAWRAVTRTPAPYGHLSVGDGTGQYWHYDTIGGNR